MRAAAVILAGLALLACSGDQDRSANTRPDTESRGITGCDIEDAGDTLDALIPIQERFADTNDSALTTRNLDPVIAEMRTVRSDLATADIPACGNVIRQEFIAAFDAFIAGYVAADAGSLDASHFETAQAHLRQAITYINGINP